MATFGDWMRLLRIHSAALTWAVMTLGFILGGGSLFSFQALLWAVLACLWHGWGFTQNSWVDRELDRQDPGKKAFPLVTRAISDDDAGHLTTLLMMATMALGMWLVGPNLLAAAVLIFATLMGFAYNYWSKKNALAWVALIFGWGTFPIVPYIVLTGGIDLLGIIFLLTFWAHFAVNTGAESAMKDLDSGERNVVIALGGRLEKREEKDWFIGNWKTSLLAIGPKTCGVFFGAVLLWMLAPRIPLFEATIAIVLYSMFAGISFLTAARLVRTPSPWNDRETTKRCVIIEVFAAFSVVAAMLPVLGLIGVVAMIVLPLLYYILVNYATFKTRFTPAV